MKLLLYFSAFFLGVAIISGAFGFGLDGGQPNTTGQAIFWVFLVLFAISLLVWIVRRPQQQAPTPEPGEAPGPTEES